MVMCMEECRGGRKGKEVDCGGGVRTRIMQIAGRGFRQLFRVLALGLAANMQDLLDGIHCSIALFREVDARSDGELEGLECGRNLKA